MMRYACALTLALIAVTATAFADATKSAITEREVRAFMQTLEDVARRRDVDAMGAMLADECRIELRARIDGREQVTNFTKHEYVRMLGGGYAAMRDLQRYDYVIEDLEVTIAPDGQAADVRARVLETTAFQGVTMVTRSDERSRLERRGGKLAFVAVKATTEAASKR